MTQEPHQKIHFRATSITTSFVHKEKISMNRLWAKSNFRICLLNLPDVVPKKYIRIIILLENNLQHKNISK